MTMDSKGLVHTSNQTQLIPFEDYMTATMKVFGAWKSIMYRGGIQEQR